MSDLYNSYKVMKSNEGLETKEIWRDIKDYEGLYQVSNLGRIKSSYTQDIKSEKKEKEEYYHREKTKMDIFKFNFIKKKLLK